MAVVDDYEHALKRVVGIERDSIWHLTNMARDGVEQAREIAHVIEADIKTVSAKGRSLWACTDYG